MPFPTKGGDGSAESTTTTPDPHANPGGDKGKEVRFKDQETFDALIASRIAQAKRSWETDERTKIVEEVTKQVQDTIRTDAERKAAEESGQYKKLYEDLLGTQDFANVPKDSHLYRVFEAATKQLTDAETAVAKLVEDELKSLADAMKALLPADYPAEKKLDWIRSAKVAAGTTNGKPPGNNPNDPDPSKTQGKTVEDVVRELTGRIAYGTGARGRFSSGEATNGGS